MRLLTRPCTLVARGTTTYDTYGDPTGGAIETSTLCELQPVERIGEHRDTEQGNIQIDVYKIYLPGDAVVDGVDAVVIDGLTYELQGDPTPRRNPRTGEFLFTEGWVRKVG